MRRIKILMMGLIIILITTLGLTVNAADATVTLKPSKTELQPGDTFTVIVNAKCEEGINGIEGLFSYDEDKLELIEKEVEGVKIKIESLNPLKWYNLGEGLKFEVAYGLNSGSATEGDIVKATFKVKDTVAEGSKAKVTVSDIMLYSYEDSNSEKDIGTKEIEISIVEEKQPGGNTGDDSEKKELTKIEVISNATKTEYKEGDEFKEEGLKIKATYSDGSTKEITDYEITDGDELRKGQISVTISYTENGITKTTTQSIEVIENILGDDGEKDDGKKDDGEMPDTGVSSIVGMIVVFTVFAVVCLVKYNKYREI